jgi:hypothetical protein
MLGNAEIFSIQEDRCRELDYVQSLNEENILEQGNFLTEFTLVKKQNVMGSIYS